jgi:hypothetical protein
MNRENIFIKILGFLLTLTAFYFIVCKQIIMPIVGVTKSAIVIGFKSKGSNTPSDRRCNNKKLFSAKTAYARFLPTGAKDSIIVLSDGNPMLCFLNYSQHDHVTVACLPYIFILCLYGYYIISNEFKTLKYSIKIFFYKNIYKI